MGNGREQVAELLATGLSVAQVARATGLATNTVRYHRDRLRALPPPSPDGCDPEDVEAARSQVETRGRVAELLELGLSRTEVARRLGVSNPTVSYHARRLGKIVDERFARRYDWAAVQRFYDAGNGVAECAEAFGFSRQTWHAAVNAGKVVPRPSRVPLAELCVAGRPKSRGNLNGG